MRRPSRGGGGWPHLQLTLLLLSLYSLEPRPARRVAHAGTRREPTDPPPTSCTTPTAALLRPLYSTHSTPPLHLHHRVHRPFPETPLAHAPSVEATDARRPHARRRHGRARTPRAADLLGTARPDGLHGTIWASTARRRRFQRATPPARSPAVTLASRQRHVDRARAPRHAAPTAPAADSADSRRVDRRGPAVDHGHRGRRAGRGGARRPRGKQRRAVQGGVKREERRVIAIVRKLDKSSKRKNLP